MSYPTEHTCYVCSHRIWSDEAMTTVRGSTIRYRHTEICSEIERHQEEKEKLERIIQRKRKQRLELSGGRE